jgi:hypothetical protein
MDPIIGGGLLKLGGAILDKIFPDPEQRARAQIELMKAEKEGELQEAKLQMSAILAEAQSNDPWTSRARPSFLYVMYILILACIPMGILAAFHPEVAGKIAAGMGAWLKAIPEELWTVFGIGYLGYTGFRSFDKLKKGNGK